MPRPARAAARPVRKPAVDLKPAILAAARRLCVDHGVDGISARRIAADVGCSATAIYLYYRNLDDVLHHLRMEGHAILAGHFAEVDPGLPPPARLRAIGRAYHRFGLEHPHDYELMFLRRFPQAPPPEVVERESATLRTVAEAIAAGVASGDFRSDLDPLLLANGVWSMTHGLTALAVTGLLRQTAPRGRDRLLEGVLDAIDAWLRAPAAAPRAPGRPRRKRP